MADRSESPQGEPEIPERPEHDAARLRVERLRGIETKAGLALSGLSWVRPHVRSENINLHTTFPRSRRFMSPTVGIVLGLASALALLLPLLWLGWRLLVVQAVIIGIPVGLFALGCVFPLWESGSFYQRVRQEIGGRAWLLDMYRAVQRGPGPVPYLRGLMIWVGYVASGMVAKGLAKAGTWSASCPPTWWPGWLPGRLSPRWSLPTWDLSTWAQVPIAVASFLISLVLFIMWLDRLGRGRRRDRSPALPEEVERLSMVQALSWTSIGRYPGEKKGSQRPLIFVSTFNEGFEGYVGGFVEGMQGGLTGPWGLAPGFPHPRNGFRPFLEYVDRTSYPLDHSFIAYPHCSVVDIRNALALDRNFRSLSAEYDGGTLSAAKFRQFLSRSGLALAGVPDRPHLSPTVPPLEIVDQNDRSLDPPTVGDPDRGGNVTASTTTTTIFLSVLPLATHADANKVRYAIRSMPGGFPEANGIYAHAHSPFMWAWGTHLARLTVVTHWTDIDGDPHLPLYFEDESDAPQPEHAWLLFSAQFDTVNAGGANGVREWLLRVHTALGAGNVNEIWGTAAAAAKGHEGIDVNDANDWADLLLENGRHEPLVRQVDHHDNTMWDVLRSLYTHREVTSYLRDNPTVDPTDFVQTVGAAITPFRRY